MNSPRPGWAVLLLALASLALLGASWACRAARHPYLAAEQFLHAQGLEVIQSDDLRPLNGQPPAAISLMLLGERKNMSARQAQELLAWVYAGGRLLVTVHNYWAAGVEADPLLDPLNLHLLNAYASAGSAPTAARTTLTELYLESESTPLLLGFAPGRHLEDADDLAQSWANSPQGTHMLQLSLGAGTLTVVSDTGLWRNQAIGQFDNAWLLWYLNQGRKVVLHYQAPAPTGFEQLAGYPATLACALGLLGLSLWAWATRRRPPAPRREHGAGVILSRAYRRADREHLLRELREDIRQCAARRHAGFARLPVAGQWQLLARLAGTSTSHIARALSPNPARRLSAAAFSQQVVQLQAIRNAL